MKQKWCSRIFSGFAFLLSYQAVASSFYQDDDALRLRVRNELRRADRPSAGADREIYAWVQGLALEYNSRYYQDRIGVDVGGFYVYKLGAKDNYSTRWYLRDHDSFARYTAAVKIKFSDALQLKVGRMVTDTAYTGQDDILIFNSSSQRTMPSLSDAAVLKYRINTELDLYTIYRIRDYTYPYVTEGVHKSGPMDPQTLQHNRLRPQYITALSWNRKCDHIGLSTAWQEDVSMQFMTRGSGCFPVGDNESKTIKPEFTAFYARLNGASANYEGPGYAYVVSSQLSYIVPQGSVFMGAGKTGDKPNPLSGIDTDIGYPFDLSIDRNHNDMWSFQLGGTINLPGNAFVGAAEVMTNGYEDYDHKIAIHGMGTNIFLGYQPPSGLFKGLKAMLILNKAREHRNNSELGDRLDYYDIKLNLQYDFLMN